MDSEEAATDPEQAFWLLSDETRVAILHSLWASSDTPISFTELRERVDSPDSGQFNYHLGKLREHFVSRSETGYELTQAGREVVRAVPAGSITEQPHMDPTPINGHCEECGDSLIIRYDEYGVSGCSECDETLMWNEFPPAGLAGRMPEEVAVVFDEWTRNRFHLAMDGICPNCAGEMSAEILDASDEGDASTNHRCGNCKYEARVPMFGRVIRHRSVVSCD
jgi:ssDNA-binding Zn-finger/Zn-ribbon topoisomerase 1